MKKILLAITSLVLTATLSASGSHINLYGGSSEINSESGYIFGTGYDFIFTKPKATAIEIGLGLDVLYNSVESNSHSYNGDLSLLIGFKRNNFAIRTGIGYGLGSGSNSGNDFTQSGLVYSAATEYDFGKYGIGLKYKHQEFEQTFLNETNPATTKNILLYFYFKK